MTDIEFQDDSLILRSRAGLAGLNDGSKKVVHYTSGENALKIIQGKEFWLRNARCMNDYGEVIHGISLLVKVLTRENDGARRKRLIALYDRIAPGMAEAAIDKFDGWSDAFRSNTFIGCLSLIDAKDTLGKLSMWRAYCPKDAGVALVMNPTPFLAETSKLNAFSIPVWYASDEEFSATIDRQIAEFEDRISSSPDLSAIEPSDVENELFWQLVSFAMSLKHPAFCEEEELRIFYLPEVLPSPAIEQDVVAIGGIPQIVQKIPLEHAPEKGLFGADIPSLLDKIIIGPTEYPDTLKAALVEALTQNGVVDPSSKIVFSNIPLR